MRATYLIACISLLITASEYTKCFAQSEGKNTKNNNSAKTDQTSNSASPKEIAPDQHSSNQAEYTAAAIERAPKQTKSTKSTLGKCKVIRTGNTDDIGEEPEVPTTYRAKKSNDNGTPPPSNITTPDSVAKPNVVDTETPADTEPQSANVVGKLSTTKDEQGTLTSMSIKSEAGTTYIVFLNGKSKEMQELNDTNVEINGQERTKNGKKMLYVESWTKIERDVKSTM